MQLVIFRVDCLHCPCSAGGPPMVDGRNPPTAGLSGAWHNTHLSTHPFTHPFIHPYTHPLVDLLTHPPTLLCPFIHSSVHQLSVQLFISPSIHPPTQLISLTRCFSGAGLSTVIVKREGKMLRSFFLLYRVWSPCYKAPHMTQSKDLQVELGSSCVRFGSDCGRIYPQWPLPGNQIPWVLILSWPLLLTAIT